MALDTVKFVKELIKNGYTHLCVVPCSFAKNIINAVINNDNIFLQETSKNEILNIPIAHRDGNFYIDKNGLKELEKNNQILLKYCDKDGVELNINGSIEQIAGICNKEKNVFGLMPHPERAIEELLGCQDGIKMLQGFFK